MTAESRATSGDPLILPELGEADYRADPALGSTQISWLTQSAGTYRHGTDHPFPATDAMRRGTAVHSLVLGGPEVVRIDAPDWRSVSARGERARAEAAGQVPVTAPEWEQVNGAADAVRAHPQARDLLAGALTEVSAFRVVDGVPCKGRIDALHPGAAVIDLKKTAKGADLRSFGRAAADYGYFRQGASYLDVLGHQIGDVPYYLVVVEEQAPHWVAVYELDPYDLTTGANEAHAARQTYRRAVETGEWPGPYATDPTQPPPLLSLPSWYRSPTEETP